MIERQLQMEAVYRNASVSPQPQGTFRDVLGNFGAGEVTETTVRGVGEVGSGEAVSGPSPHRITITGQ